MKIDVINKENKKVDAMELPPELFGIRWNPELVSQALQVQLANSRERLAHTKGRGEVRGGGKKPWRQKGTGRARHGSIRSPIWKGGGVTFGPTSKVNFARKINKKMRRLALWSILAKKLKDDEFKVVDSLETGEAKTKNAMPILKNILGKEINALLIPKSQNKNLRQITRNIPRVDALSPKSLNIYDLLKHKNIIVEKNAVQEIIEHYKISQ